MLTLYVLTPCHRHDKTEIRFSAFLFFFFLSFLLRSSSYQLNDQMEKLTYYFCVNTIKWIWIYTHKHTQLSYQGKVGTSTSSKLHDYHLYVVLLEAFSTYAKKSYSITSFASFFVHSLGPVLFSDYFCVRFKWKRGDLYK